MGCKNIFTCCKNSDSKEPKSDLPVDRGWAWVIILASAGIFAFNAGTYKCFGIFKLEILENFPDCTQDTSMWILSMASTFSLMFGPIVSILLNKFSHRIVGLIGSSLFSAGFLLSSIAPSCQFLFFSFSIVYAIGGGTLLVVCFTSFAPYFMKHRALAVGIMASGSGVGGVIFPPLVTFLFEVFTFRNAMLLYGGVCLQVVIFVALLRPMSFYEELAKKKAEASMDTTPVPIIVVANSSNENVDHIPNEEFRERSHSQYDLTSTQMASEKEAMLHSSLPYSLDQLISQNNNELASKTDLLGSAVSLSTVPTVENTKHIHSSNLHISQAKDINNSDDKPKNKPTVYHWKIWVRPKVMLTCAIMFFAMTANCLFISTTPSFAKENGVLMETLSIIMAVTGAAEVVCRILNGWVADMKVMPAISQLALVLFLSGISALICAAFPGILGISVIYSVIALVGSSMFSLLPIVFIELEGVENLPAITGINNVFQAMAFLSSAPIANGLHGAYLSWQYVTYYTAGCYFMAGVIGFSYSICTKVTKK